MMGWTGVLQRWVHPLTRACRIASVAPQRVPRCACQMLSHLSSHQFLIVQGSGLRCGSHLLCRLLTSAMWSKPVPQLSVVCRLHGPDTWQISRGKTRILPRIDAGFTKCTLVGVATHAVDRGLRGHVPARPECITPHIRFLFIALRFRLGLPPHPASRRRTCPLASLRLYKPGTGTCTQLDSCHARHTRRANRRCAALSRSVQRPKGARLSAMLGLDRWAERISHMHDDKLLGSRDIQEAPEREYGA